MALFSRPPATHIPPVQGVRMDGTPFALPDPDAPATLLVVSFDDDAAPLAGQWMRLGQRLGEHAPGLALVDALIVPPRMKLLGDIGLITLRARAERDGALDRTVAIYERRKPLRKTLGISDAVTALLIGPDGAITWRGDGEIDLHEVESLEPALAALLAAPPNTDPTEEPEESESVTQP